MTSKSPRVTITANGPYLVEGSLPLARQHIVTSAEGESLDWRQGDVFLVAEKYALCRCGRSATKPFCDGAHQRSGFDGTETASREPYEAQASRIEGPSLVLQDAAGLCAFARFCDPQGQIWNLVEKSDQPRARELVIEQASHCPGGRLVARDRSTDTVIEHPLEASIGVVQDTAKGIGGPLWVRGGVPVVGADGQAYEVRGRVALCRCGESKNKPFCDGTHAAIGFDRQA